MFRAVDVYRSQRELQTGSPLELSQRLRIHNRAGSIGTGRNNGVAADGYGASQSGGEGLPGRADFRANRLAQANGQHCSRRNKHCRGFCFRFGWLSFVGAGSRGAGLIGIRRFGSFVAASYQYKR